MSVFDQQNINPPTSDDLSSFSVSQLSIDTVTDFSLYMKVSHSFILYAQPPYRWGTGEFDRLLSQGHSVLYYCSADAQKVEAYVRLASMTSMDLTLEPRLRVLNLTKVGMELTRILHDYPLTQASIVKAEEISNAMIDLVNEDKTCVVALGKLANHDYYTYFHSARVAAYALALALQMGESNSGRLQELAVGCLLHDIGKSKVSPSIINKPGVLTKEEWGEMCRHPEMGHGIIETSTLGAVPRGIVLSHHERTDGKGYPHGLGESELLMEVRIAAFADVFDALTTNRSYQMMRSRFEALDLIRFKLLDGIDHNVFEAMVEILRDSSASDSKS